MSLTFVLLTPAVEPLFAVQLKGRTLVLGRAQDAHLRLPDPSVSARHACLKKRGAHYLISDEGSTNGTALLSDDPQAPPVYLAPGSPRILQEGDILQLGHVQLRLHMQSPPGEYRWITEPQELPRELVQAALSERGVSPTEEELHRALEELETLPDESLLAHKSPESPPAPEPRPLPQEQDTRESWTTDWLLGLSALLLLLIALLLLLQWIS